MRTYNKLIATIFASQAKAFLRLRTGQATANATDPDCVASVLQQEQG